MSRLRDADADVVISGLGPTGLVLAHVLGRRGHRVVVLEREPVFYGNARAVYTDDECMRIFQSIGAAEALQEKMLLETPVQLVRRDGSVMAQYLPLDRPFGWPVVNFFYQPYLETALGELLERHPNVEVRRGRELVGLTQNADSVVVSHRATREVRGSDRDDSRLRRAGDDDVQTISARYLVGADGGRSVVRAELGIEMTGKSFPEPWLVVDLRQKDPERALRHLPYFNFVVDPTMPVVSCVQPEGFHRFEFMLMPGMTKEWMEKPETVRELLSAFVDPDAFEIKRQLVYTFNALMAKEWRRGRVFLAGDAAHMTPQFMGQGASSGVRDAQNLGWKLSAVLRGQAGDELLDTYESERRAHAQAMIDASVRMKSLVSMTSPIGTRVRDAVVALLQATPATRRWIREGGFKPRPVFRDGRYLGLPRRRRRAPEGAPVPQPEVRLFNGRRRLLDDLLGDGFALVGLGCDPREGLSEAALEGLASVDARFVTIYPYGKRPQGSAGVARDGTAGVTEVEDLSGSMIRWFGKAGFRKRAVAIVRPDRFAFGVVELSELGRAIAELVRQLGSREDGAISRAASREPQAAVA